MRMHAGRKGVCAIALTAGLALAGCGGDDASDDLTTDSATEPATEPTGDDASDAAGPTATITAVDYAFEDVPATLAVGTTVALRNDSEGGEFHELLAVLLPDDEERPFAELLQLPEEEFAAIFGAGLRGAVFATPGSDSGSFTLPVPPLVLGEPGRYAFVCFIPTGAPPDEVTAALEAFFEGGAQGEPEHPQTGPPHAANGMFTEVTVG